MAWIRGGQWVGAALFALLAVVVAACGSGGGNSAPAVNRSGTITIWHQWEGSYLDAKKAIFDAYTKQYPNVLINLVHQADVNAKATTVIPTGQGPDIVAGVDDQLGRYAKLEIIKPIEGVDGVDINYMKANFVTAAVDAEMYGGHIYGMPETVEAITMVYDRDLVSAEQLPTTTDGLLSFAKSYQKAHPGMFGVVWNTRDDAYVNAPWVYGFGGYYVRSDGSIGLTTDGSKAGFSYIASFRGLIPADINNPTADALFKQKKAAIIINGPWALPDYGKANINYGLAVLPMTPAGKPAQPFVGVKTLMVASTALNVPLAVDVMKWFDNSENEIAQSVVNKEIPANKAALADPQVQAIPEVNGFAAQVVNGTALPNTPYMSALWDPVKHALQAIWGGAQTVDAAVAGAQTEAQNNIAQIK